MEVAAFVIPERRGFSDTTNPLSLCPDQPTGEKLVADFTGVVGGVLKAPSDVWKVHHCSLNPELQTHHTDCIPAGLSAIYLCVWQTGIGAANGGVWADSAGT